MQHSVYSGVLYDFTAGCFFCFGGFFSFLARGTNTCSFHAYFVGGCISYAVFYSVLGAMLGLCSGIFLYFSCWKLIVGALTSPTCFSAELWSAQCRLPYSAFALGVLDASLVQRFSHAKIL